MKPTLAIVGGGASGLCAAVCAGRSGGFDRVLLLERGPRVGKKLLATGNGRCNLTNRFFSPQGLRSGFCKACLRRLRPDGDPGLFREPGHRPL